MSLFDPRIYSQCELKLKRLLRTYQQRHLFRDGTPLVFSFLVTNRCFLHCAHCFYHETLAKASPARFSEELTLDEFRRLSESLDWIFMALFCGGEPFLRKDLHEIIGLFRKNNRLFWADSATNGQLTHEIVRQVELICQQDKTKVYSLSFSIDGFEEYNDAVRGKGTFARALETWRECKKLAALYGNLELNFSTTINHINQASLADFFRWGLAELQPNRVALLKIRQNPRGGSSLADIDPASYNEARTVIANAVRAGRLGDVNSPGTHLFSSAASQVYQTLLTGKRSFFCYAGRHGAWVDYNGDVNVCEVFPDAQVSGESLKMGNLRDVDMDFPRLWNSERAKTLKQLVNR